MLNKKEIIYLDILKIFACFMVVINHTNGYILENKTLINVTFYCIMFSLCKVGVPIFLMITGVLVLNKNYSYKKILKCILRVLVPTFFLSLILYIHDTDINNVNIVSFLKLILSKPYIATYWYVYALVGVYITLPFLQKMIKKFTNQDYAIFTLIFLIVPTFINYLTPSLNFNINHNLQLGFFPVIIATIVCGNYISKIKISKKKLIGSIIVFIIFYIIMFLTMYLPYLNNGEISYALDSWNSFPIVLMSMTLFYICRYLFENKKYSSKFTNIITTIASTTFGIYLIHTSLGLELYKLDIVKKMFDFNDIIAALILDFIVFIVCMVITYILRKNPFIKKFL